MNAFDTSGFLACCNAHPDGVIDHCDCGGCTSVVYVVRCKGCSRLKKAFDMDRVKKYWEESLKDRS